MAADTDFVRVGCKMPNGVILNLTRYEIVNKEHGVIQREGDDRPTVTLKGNAVKVGMPDLSIDGYVFTKVPKAFWDEWLKTHADSSLLRDGYIKAAASLDQAKGLAADHAKERGMFPRLTEKDERTRALKVEKFNADDKAA